MSRGRVVFHAAGLFVMSCVMSANANVLPQLFYQRLHAERKVLFLAVCLLAGTVAATLGVLASRGAAVSRRAALAAVGATALSEIALFLVTSAAGYAALNAAAQLGANFVMNHLDHAAAARAGEGHRRLQDTAGTVLRLLGMLAAPAFFTLYADRPAARFAALAGAFALALASAASLLDRAAEEASPSAAPTAGRPLDSADRLVFAFVIAVYVALFLFAANLIYLLRDVAGVARPEQRGGLAIVVCFGAALVANAAVAVLRRRLPERGPRLVAFAAPIPFLAFAAGALLGGARPPFGGMLAACAVIGASYGVFLAEVREYASRGARAEGKSALLTLFNNMSNLSSLLAFVIMTVLAAANASRAALAAVLAVIAALPVAALPLLLVAFARRPAEGAR